MSQWVENSVLHLDVDMLGGSQTLDVSLANSSQTLDLELIGGGSGRFPYYTGSYQVDPRKVEQTLETRNKSMSGDVIINPIFYSETLNIGGGNTAYIGME